MSELVPVVDLFAGPGGLSEGFSAVGRREGNPYFNIALSIEKDIYAYNTLLLRSYFRQFPHGSAPDEYYSFLRGEISFQELLLNEEDGRTHYRKKMAKMQAWHATLGSGKDFDEKLDSRIEEITKKSDRWILIGGPPCQAYSIIGRARNSRNIKYNPEEDERTHLYKEYLRILAKHKPAVFLMENVKGIISSKLNGRSIIDKIIHDLERPSMIYRNLGPVSYKIFSLVKDEENKGQTPYIGLKPVDFVIECEKYGIPQKRHRLILLGIREDLYVPPRPNILKEEKLYKVSDIIDGLPKLRSGLSREHDNAQAWVNRLKEALQMPWLEEVKGMSGTEVYRDIKDTIQFITSPARDRGDEFIPFDTTLSDKYLSQWFIDPRIGGVCNHHSKSHMVEDIYRYLYVSSYGKCYGNSPRLDDFPTGLLPKHENVNSGHFDDRFRVQVWDQPSTTITSHLEKDGHYYIHPDPFQSRSLTVREAARLQTFPDNYFFCGGKKQQYKQVGNAVPPLLAYKIAKIIKDYLETI